MTPRPPSPFGQEFLALAPRPPRHTPNRQVIEHQQSPSAQRMAAVQRLAVEPLNGSSVDPNHRGTQALQGAAKLPGNAQGLPTPVEDRSRGHMHECPPAIVLGLV